MSDASVLKAILLSLGLGVGASKCLVVVVGVMAGIWWSQSELVVGSSEYHLKFLIFSHWIHRFLAPVRSETQKWLSDPRTCSCWWCGRCWQWWHWGQKAGWREEEEIWFLNYSRVKVKCDIEVVNPDSTGVQRSFCLKRIAPGPLKSYTLTCLSVIYQEGHLMHVNCTSSSCWNLGSCSTIITFHGFGKLDIIRFKLCYCYPFISFSFLQLWPVREKIAASSWASISSSPDS